MEKIICDTDVIIDFLNIHNQRHEYTQHIINESITIKNVLITPITLLELLIGCKNKLQQQKLLNSINRFSRVNINEQIVNNSIRLLIDFNLSHNLQISDCFIASIALYYDFELFTYNVKDFRFIPKLKLYKPE